MCKVTLIAGGSSTLGFDSQLNLLLIAQNSTISSMVSLTIVAAALGLVTFGNAEVASRYLKSSSQPATKPMSNPFKVKYDSNACPKKSNDGNLNDVLNYDKTCKGNPTGSTSDCPAKYEKALRAWVVLLIGKNPDDAKKEILADKVRTVLHGYPENPTDLKKRQFIDVLSMKLPASFDKKSGQQATFGFKGKNAKFLGQLGMFMQASCLRN
ncbi:unnamed protein product [Albugo candida]|uniref:Uncharacterized protein n=1 Tax=Albugo candida TaxID=65357 RepID=A0A024FYI2_9STRA|nr:unnamed protein product [Albugo candida]|eukprot:CCI11729.1 unnamed protein product [Albugo candida]